MNYDIELMRADCTIYLEKCYCIILFFFKPIAHRKAKIVYNFGLSECNRVKV